MANVHAFNKLHLCTDRSTVYPFLWRNLHTCRSKQAVLTGWHILFYVMLVLSKMTFAEIEIHWNSVPYSLNQKHLEVPFRCTSLWWIFSIEMRACSYFCWLLFCWKSFIFVKMLNWFPRATFNYWIDLAKCYVTVVTWNPFLYGTWFSSKAKDSWWISYDLIHPTWRINSFLVQWSFLSTWKTPGGFLWRSVTNQTFCSQNRITLKYMFWGSYP